MNKHIPFGLLFSTLCAMSQAGAQCNALSFDGSSDRVMVPYSTSFPVAVFTVGAWIKTSSRAVRSRAAIMSFGEDNSTGNSSWTLSVLSDGTFEVMLEDARDNNAAYRSGKLVTDNVWHHVAATRESTGRLVLYVDGMVQATFSQSIVPSNRNQQFLTFGCTHGKFGPPPPAPRPLWFYQGIIDDPAMWNVALTATQIKAVYERGVDPNSSGLVGFWKLDEGSGQTVKDDSKAANHGFLGANSNSGGDSADPQWTKLSGNASYTVFGRGCLGSGGTPTLAASPNQLPVSGKTFEVSSGSLPASGVVAGLFGVSKTNWGALKLPFDLSPVGMKGCLLYTDIIFMQPIVYMGTTAKWVLPIPYDPTFLGVSFYQQGLVVDGKANSFGATLTNSAEALIGCK